MGRPEAPVDHTVPELGALAGHLRDWRAAAALTYEVMVDPEAPKRIGPPAYCSAATLKRAASGRALPAEGTVTAYVEVCATQLTASLDTPEGRHDLRMALQRAQLVHQRASETVERMKRGATRSTVAPRPQFVRDQADLSGALRDAYRHAGRPAVRTMAARVGRWRLPHSTAHSIVTGRAMPKDSRQYVAFLEACGIRYSKLFPWFAAWHKVYGDRRDPGFADRTGDESTLSENLFSMWAYASAHSPSVQLRDTAA